MANEPSPVKKLEAVQCEQCEKLIQVHSNIFEDTFIVLQKLHLNGTATNIYPHVWMKLVDRDNLVFCDITCLTEYMQREYNKTQRR